MKKTKVIWTFFLVSCWTSAHPQITDDAASALRQVNARAVRADMSFLADDLLQGRAPGSRGFDLGARYVESQFIQMGLLPAGEDSSFRQKVMLKKGTIDEAQSRLQLISTPAATDLVYGDDYILSPRFATPDAEVTAALVFVGYGVSAPELGYDDYARTDVRDKVVVYFNQAPDHFPANERAYFSSYRVKQDEAAKRGAVGVISLSLPGYARTSWEATVRRSRQGTFRWTDPAGRASGDNPTLKVIATCGPAQTEKLFLTSGKDLAMVVRNLGTTKKNTFPLRQQARIKTVTRMADTETYNLLAMIPGSDDELKHEFVVYAAHLDHFGIGAPVKGDSIYNGAHDNASGTALVLEIARTYKRLANAPRRSILFAIVTAEESGLLGSDYFVQHPTVGKGNMVANLSIDMPFFFHPVLDIVPYGAQHSSLSGPLEEARRFLNLDIAPDPFPEQVIFIRSDHFSFVREGIPALFIKSGFKTTSSDTVDRSVSDVAWRRTTYHTPQDDMTQAFDWDGAATHVKINFLTGLLVANRTDRPAWNEGDFFGKRFGHKTDTRVNK